MATFNQQGQAVGQQANFETNYGTVSFSPNSSSADMHKVIQALKSELAGIKELSTQDKAQLDEALDSAASVEPSPNRTDVKAKLDKAGSTLKSIGDQVQGADDLAKKILNLAKTVFAVGKWVIAAVAF
jgi:hypothetical protein